MKVLVDVDVAEVRVELSEGLLMGEIRRGLESSTEVKKFNMERVIDFLRGEGCPQQILSTLNEWNHTKIVTLIDLQNWLRGCGVKQ